MIVTGRYLKFLYKFRMWIHGTVATAIIIITVANVVYFWRTEHTHPEDGSIGTQHNTNAKIIFYWMLVQYVIGILVKISLEYLKWNSKITMAQKFVHQISAYFLILIGNYQLYTGMKSLGSPYIIWMASFHIVV